MALARWKRGCRLPRAAPGAQAEAGLREDGGQRPPARAAPCRRGASPSQRVPATLAPGGARQGAAPANASRRSAAGGAAGGNPSGEAGTPRRFSLRVSPLGRLLFQRGLRSSDISLVRLCPVLHLPEPRDSPGGTERARVPGTTLGPGPKGAWGRLLENRPRHWGRSAL